MLDPNDCEWDCECVVCHEYRLNNRLTLNSCIKLMDEYVGHDITQLKVLHKKLDEQVKRFKQRQSKLEERCPVLNNHLKKLFNL